MSLGSCQFRFVEVPMLRITDIIIAMFCQEGNPLSSQRFVSCNAGQLGFPGNNIMQQVAISKASLRSAVYDSCALRIMASQCLEKGSTGEA